MRNLHFVDDTILIVVNVAETVEMVRHVEDEIRCGLVINRSKMNIMVTDRINILQLTCALDVFETVNESVYFGSVISNSRCCKAEIKCRIECNSAM